MEENSDSLPEILSDNTFNPRNLKISPVYANYNLLAGPDHWQIKNWNPEFGDISRYKIISVIGTGTYSEVFAGTQDSELCAIKVLKPVNNDRIRREIKILTILSDSPNTLHLMDVLVDPKNGIISIVTKFVPNTPWRSLMGSLSLNDIRVYAYKVLHALAYTHSKGIMHRDVKPSNILCMKPSDEVVLADWGLAEFYHPLRKYSAHVGTKAYKAPELLLEYGFYNYSVDIWSLGVTILEFLTKRIHVFQSSDPDMMIYSIASVVGGQKIIDSAKKYKMEMGPVTENDLKDLPGIGIRSCFPRSRRQMMDEDAIDLIEKMLIVDHRERITANDALAHKFFDSIRPEGSEKPHV